VRLTTVVQSNESEEDADKRLLTMIPEFLPTLSAYLPGRDNARASRVSGHAGAPQS
jgi:hypothetical protein